MKTFNLLILFITLISASCSLFNKKEDSGTKKLLAESSEFDDNDQEQDQLDVKGNDSDPEVDSILGTGVEMEEDLLSVSDGQTGSSSNQQSGMQKNEVAATKAEEAKEVSSLTESSTEVIQFQGEEVLEEKVETQAAKKQPSSSSDDLAEDFKDHVFTAQEGTEGGIKGEALETYSVVKNETLMSISFKIYGDYRLWEELFQLNKDVIQGDGETIRAGTKIKFRPPQNKFVWRPEGNPYLIQNGDTLGLISHKVYGTQKRWKFIWENNRPLIINPNLIFAGFTIYYKDLNQLNEKSLTSL